MKPYTSDTGPPEMSPEAIVLHKASHVAIKETQAANIVTTEKFFCVFQLSDGHYVCQHVLLVALAVLHEHQSRLLRH